ncbi:Lecithin retinol acyltransferase [Halopseudomonas pachastrellae]|nr:Lecithin retinol acyltransferase [Halopseudomonas pachastrellae]
MVKQRLSPSMRDWRDASGARACGLTVGDHLVVSRGLYSHHGIYLGAGLVAHYKGLSNGLFRRQQDTRICAVPLARFADDTAIRVVRYPSAPYSRTQVVTRARSRLDEDKYQILFNNCEHFARWCWLNCSSSIQVRTGVTIAVSAMILGGVALAIGRGGSR